MNEKKYVVPEGMMRAFIHAENHNGPKWDEGVLRAMLAAALRWLSEKPIVPTPEQHMDISGMVRSQVEHDDLTMWHFWAEWQRRMFLAPDPDEAIKDMLLTGDAETSFYSGTRINCKIIEAYRRGRAGR